MTEPEKPLTPFEATPWSYLRVKFSKEWDHGRNFPAAGVYRLYDSAGTLLYVGLGAMPYFRWKQHAKRKTWWADVDHYRTTVEWFKRYKDAELAEKQAIQTEGPLYNIKDSLRAVDSMTPEMTILVRKIGVDRATEILRAYIDAATEPDAQQSAA